MNDSWLWMYMDKATRQEKANMKKWNEFMDKVKADEALQKEFAEIIGDSGEKLTKEQKEKIAELAGKLGIELNIEGELSEEELEKVAGGISERELFLLNDYMSSTLFWQWECPLCGKCFTYSWGCIEGKTKTAEKPDMIERNVYNDIRYHLRTSHSKENCENSYPGFDWATHKAAEIVEASGLKKFLAPYA